VTEYEQQRDFESYLQIAKTVTDFYNHDIDKITKWWETPQEGLDGLSPKQMLIKNHRNRISTYVDMLRKLQK